MYVDAQVRLDETVADLTEPCDLPSQTNRSDLSCSIVGIVLYAKDDDSATTVRHGSNVPSELPPVILRATRELGFVLESLVLNEGVSHQAVEYGFVQTVGCYSQHTYKHEPEIILAAVTLLRARRIVARREHIHPSGSLMSQCAATVDVSDSCQILFALWARCVPRRAETPA